MTESELAEIRINAVSRRQLKLSTVTGGSRVILIMYPMLTLYYGFCFVYGDPRRTLGPSFDYAKTIMSIPDWGRLFTLLGVVILVSYLWGFYKHNRWPAAVGLLFGAFLCWWWAIQFAIAIKNAGTPPMPFPVPDVLTPLPSITAPGIWVFIGTCFAASTWSVLTDDVGDKSKGG